MVVEQLNVISRRAAASHNQQLRAGMVPKPSFFTLALQDVRRLRSRSVRRQREFVARGFQKEIRQDLESWSLRSTTPWVAVSSRGVSNLLTVILHVVFRRRGDCFKPA